MKLRKESMGITSIVVHFITCESIMLKSERPLKGPTPTLPEKPEFVDRYTGLFVLRMM